MIKPFIFTLLNNIQLKHALVAQNLGAEGLAPK